MLRFDDIFLRGRLWAPPSYLDMPGRGELSLFRFGILHPKGLHCDLCHFAAAAGVHRLVGALHAIGHLAERGVLAVQMGCSGNHDEELASGGVGVAGPGHGQHAPLVDQVVFKAVGGKLALDAVARTSGTGALGIAALDHEAGNAAVEGQAVIEALLNEGNEVVHRVGGLAGVELGLHHAAALHLNRHNGVAHYNQILSGS